MIWRWEQPPESQLSLTIHAICRFRFNLPVNRGCMRRILRDQQGWLDRINLKPQFQVL